MQIADQRILIEQKRLELRRNEIAVARATAREFKSTVLRTANRG